MPRASDRERGSSLRLLWGSAKVKHNSFCGGLWDFKWPCTSIYTEHIKCMTYFLSELGVIAGAAARYTTVIQHCWEMSSFRSYRIEWRKRECCQSVKEKFVLLRRGGNPPLDTVKGKHVTKRSGVNVRVEATLNFTAWSELHTVREQKAPTWV